MHCNLIFLSKLKFFCLWKLFETDSWVEGRFWKFGLSQLIDELNLLSMVWENDFCIFFHFQTIRSKFWGIIDNSITSVLNGLIWFFARHLLLYKAKPSNTNGARMQKFQSVLFFSYLGLIFLGTEESQDNKGKRQDFFIFSDISTCQQASIHLLAVLYLDEYLLFLIPAHRDVN